MTSRADAGLAGKLRQMVAVLHTERQALAAMDIDALTTCSRTKQQLCGTLESHAAPTINAECEGLLISARELNEINRRVRNLLAVNVAARLDTLTGSTGLYDMQGNRHARIGAPA